MENDLNSYNDIPTLLTDFCSNKHKENFNCTNFVKNSSQLVGYANDVDINAAV